MRVKEIYKNSFLFLEIHRCLYSNGSYSRRFHWENKCLYQEKHQIEVTIGIPKIYVLWYCS